MHHFDEIGYEGRIVTLIKPDNEYSLRAVEKNGFRHTDDTVYDKIVLERHGVDFEIL